MSLDSGSPAQKGSPHAERKAPEPADDGDGFSHGDFVTLTRKPTKKNSSVRIGTSSFIFVESTDHSPEMLVETALCNKEVQKAMAVQTALGMRQLPTHDREEIIPLAELNTHVCVQWRPLERIHLVRRYSPLN